MKAKLFFEILDSTSRTKTLDKHTDSKNKTNMGKIQILHFREHGPRMTINEALARQLASVFIFPVHHRQPSRRRPMEYWTNGRGPQITCLSILRLTFKTLLVDKQDYFNDPSQCALQIVIVDIETLKQVVKIVFIVIHEILRSNALLHDVIHTKLGVGQFRRRNQKYNRRRTRSRTNIRYSSAKND